MKKKLVVALLVGCMVLSIGGCGKGSTDSTQISTETTANKTYLTADDYDWKDIITLGDYTGFTVDVKEEVVTDDDVQKAYDDFVSSYTTYEEVTDANTTVASDSTVNISYSCTCDGSPVDTESADNVDYTVGDYEYIEGLNDALIGKKKGDSFDLEYKTPTDYYDSDYAGKTLVYTVTVNYVTEAVVPDMSDDWFAENTSSSTKDDWLAETRKSLERQALDNMESAFRQGLSEKIVESATFKEFPKELLDSQLAYYKAGDEDTASSYGVTLEDFITNYYGYASNEDYEADLMDYIESSLKVNFALKALEDVEKVTVTDEDIAAFKKGCMELYGFTSEEEIDSYYGEDVLKKACKNDKIWEIITSKNKMNLTPLAATEQEVSQ